ncbi:hypothetical protein EXIGLDRAFT_728325 [Exidia glandulosa HHB12029]|uniref:F-box domain-containing protein n=1 Tax=Exidia glandulosa HHB12029 TaxID=1314781 RepID=A0A165LTH4_EXIGL|nr:hypothetical protein EXIGLDRAFT_728325 [Exidia glandulosa HHB12029]
MQRLPNELWASVFAFFDLSDLTIVSQVAAHWRAVAFDQPLFWRDIGIDSLSQGYLYWSKLRIDAGFDRPLALTVIIYDVDDNDRSTVTRELFPIIASCIGRVRRLDVLVPGDLFATLCDALTLPAPLLEDFCLDLSPGGRRGLLLPTGIFNASPGVLRRVSLDTITLPGGCIPAFTTVTSLRLAVADDEWYEFPPHIFDIFPSTRDLYLYGGGVCCPRPLPRATLDRFARLDFLDIGYPESENIVIFLGLPSGEIHEIVASHSDPRTVRAALAQLDSEGGIHVTFVADQEDVRVVFQSATTGRARAFTETAADFERGCYNAAFIIGEPGIAERIVSLRVPSSLWSTIHLGVPADNHISFLILEMDETNGQLPSAPLQCPKLCTLIVEAKESIVTTMEQLFTLSAAVTENDLEIHRVVV